MRKLIAATLLAIALTIAPRVSAQDAVRWHPYVVVTVPPIVMLMADAGEPAGYETKDACEERATEMVEANRVVMVLAGAEGSIYSHCSVNDIEAEKADVQKRFMVKPTEESI